MCVRNMVKRIIYAILVVAFSSSLLANGHGGIFLIGPNLEISHERLVRYCKTRVTSIVPIGEGYYIYCSSFEGSRGLCYILNARANGWRFGPFRCNWSD